MSILSAFIKTKRYRLLDSGDFQLESAWTNSQTVFMGNGNTLEDEMSNTQSNIDDVEKSLETVKGTLSLINQNITEIKVVSSLPSDAASHSTTAYFIVE